MQCRDTQSNLSAYLDHELSPRISAEIDAHLQVCANCRAELQRLERLGILIHADRVPDVPSALADRISRQARVVSGERNQKARIIRWTTSPASLRAAAAIMMIIGATAGTLLGLGASGQNSVDSAVAVLEEDPASVLNMDLFTLTPDGSLAQAYLALAESTTEEER